WPLDDCGSRCHALGWRVSFPCRLLRGYADAPCRVVPALAHGAGCHVRKRGSFRSDGHSRLRTRSGKPSLLLGTRRLKECTTMMTDKATNYVEDQIKDILIGGLYVESSKD